MAIILRSDVAITNLTPGTPQVGNIQEGLALEYDAAALTAADGVALTAWPSTSGALPFVSRQGAGAWPTMVRSDGITPAAVSFSATDKNSINTALNYTPPMTEVTAVMVVKPDVLQDGRILSLLASSGAYFKQISLTPAGKIQVGALDGTNPAVLDYKVGSWHIIQASMGTGATKTMLNSGAILNQPALPSGSVAGARLGSTGALTALFSGDLALLRIYNRALTDSEMAVHASYLAGRFGIS